MHRQTRRHGWNGRSVARGSLLLAAIATAAVAGCTAPPKVTVRPQDSLAGRHLFETEQAYIYASSEAAANQVAGDLASVARDYQKATGHAASGKGLVIVTDKDDPPYVADRKRMLDLVQRHESMRNFGPAKALPEEVQRKAEQKLGVDLFDRLMRSRCASMTIAEAAEEWRLHGRPAGTAVWVLAVPSRELVLQVTHGLAEVKMADMGVPASQVKPMLALLDWKVRGQATVDRQIGLYCTLTWQDAALDAQAKKIQFQRYQQRRGQAAMTEMGVPGLPTTQPTSSAPATRSNP